MSFLAAFVVAILGAAAFDLIIKDFLVELSSHLRMRLPGGRISNWLQARHLSKLQVLDEDWIHQAEALYIIGSFPYVDDQIKELTNALDVYVTPNNQLRVVQDRRRVSIQLADLNESVPKRILDRFVDQHPLAYRNGRYSRQALILWLRADQHNWETMLREFADH